jgi:Mrp family chromosome partitioning ATPase
LQLSDVTKSLHRHWRVSVAILVLTVAGLGVFLFTRNETRPADRWQQTVQLLVPVRDDDGQPPPGVPPNLLQGQAQVALSVETTGDALQRAGLGPEARQDVSFGFAQTTSVEEGRRDIIVLSVIAPDRAEATTLAGAYADAYIAARGKAVAQGNTKGTQDAKTAIQSFTKRLTEIRQTLAVSNPGLIPLTEASPQVNVDPTTLTVDPTILNIPAGASLEDSLLVYEGRALSDRMNLARLEFADKSANAIVPQKYATVVERPYPSQITPGLTSPMTTVAIVLALGLLLAVAVPVLIDRLDHSIRNARTASNALAAPVLSTIPVTPEDELATLAAPGTARDGAYRALAARSVATDQLPRAIVVTSPVGEMQDTVAANFAAALAGLGLKVALVATNDRQRWFVDTTNATTLPDLLALAASGRLNGQVRESLISTNLANLSILAPGPTGADALLEGLPTLLQALADAEVDVTVIAGPALLEDPAATIFAWSTRSVLWVVESGEVTEQEAREAASRLELAGATPFGVALVDADD